MDISLVRFERISKVYQNQTRIAELNKKVAVKSVQGQVDRVTLSAEARKQAQATDAGVKKTRA